MKKILVFALLSLLTLKLSANDSEKRAKLLSDNMKTSLALTEEQTVQVYKITLDKLNVLSKLKSKNNKESLQKYMIERRKYSSEIRQKLTDEQYAAWNKLRNEQLQLKKAGKEVKTEIIDDDLEFMNQ